MYGRGGGNMMGRGGCGGGMGWGGGGPGHQCASSTTMMPAADAGKATAMEPSAKARSRMRFMMDWTGAMRECSQPDPAGGYRESPAALVSLEDDAASCCSSHEIFP